MLQFLFSYRVNEGDDEQEFILLFKQLLKSIGVMMSLNNDITLTAQAACLKYLPNAISDVVQVFDPVEFRHSF